MLEFDIDDDCYVVVVIDVDIVVDVVADVVVVDADGRGGGARRPLLMRSPIARTANKPPQSDHIRHYRHHYAYCHFHQHHHHYNQHHD